MAVHLRPGPAGSGLTFEAPIAWGCLGKDAFPDRHSAQTSLRRPGRKIDRHSSRGRCAPYLCAVCGAWHVGAGR